ncbi:MAG: nucleotidyl transferase AbiEii/AbiGii toxin family protein [Candidatus Thorarchaeota archaeon]
MNERRPIPTPSVQRHLTQFSPETRRYLDAIITVLNQIGQDGFLVDRLTIIGGVALHLFYGDAYPQRLTSDIDFNFRGADTVENVELLEKLRDRLDGRIKAIFYHLGVDDDDIYINPSYPLQRIGGQVPVSQGGTVDLKIEIGFKKRIPLLGKDHKLPLAIGTGTHLVMLNVPPIEELIASKCGALLSRKRPRDLFDVWYGSSRKFDRIALRKCLVIESMTTLVTPLHEINVEDETADIRLDSNLQNVLPKGSISRKLFAAKKAEAVAFIEGLIDAITAEEREGIELFYKTGNVAMNLLNAEGILDPAVAQYPALIWRGKMIREE